MENHKKKDIKNLQIGLIATADTDNADNAAEAD